MGERPRQSSHLSRQPEVSDVWEGRVAEAGNREAGPGEAAHRGDALGPLGLANLLPPRRAARGKRRRPSPRLPACPPAPSAAARALGPQKGRGTRRRRRRTYRAGSPAPPARNPAAAAASTEQRAHTALGQIQRRRARRRGPAEGAQRGSRGVRGGERTASVTTSFRAHRPAAAG